MIVTAGSVNVSVYYYIVQDASGASPGEPVTGLLFSDIETGGSASYVRQGAARTDLTLITLASASAVHADGGFLLVDDTNLPGVYRCDYPDLAFATGVDEVILGLVVAAANNAVATPIKVQITDVDFRDAVRGGMTALPNAVADAAGGLPISDLGGLDLDTQLAATNEVTAARMGALTDWIDAGRLDVILDAILADVTGIAGAAMRGTDSALLAASAPTNFGDLSISVTTGLVSLLAATQASIDAIEADTNELQGDWVNAGRLDAILDLIAADVVNIDGAAMRGTDSASTHGDPDPSGFIDVAISSRAPATGVIVASIDTDAIDAAAVAANAFAADAFAADALVAIGGAAWDQARTSHTTAGSFGEPFAAIVHGAAEAGTLSTTQMTTDLSEATDDHYIGRTIVWITGVLAGQQAAVADYVGATGLLDYAAEPTTEAPSAGDRFILV